MRDLAKASSEVRSQVMARVVDSYTNILTVKLFARLADEDAYVREVIDEHQVAVAAHMRLISHFMFALAVMNAALLTSPRSSASGCGRRGDRRRRGGDRLAARLADRQTSQAG
jgi:ATP-binding cassette subfamily B multidrug efflux pump